MRVMRVSVVDGIDEIVVESWGRSPRLSIGHGGLRPISVGRLGNGSTVFPGVVQVQYSLERLQ